MVKHINDHQNIPKPRYLVQEGCFKAINDELKQNAEPYVPLYAYFVKSDLI